MKQTYEKPITEIYNYSVIDSITTSLGGGEEWPIDPASDAFDD